MKNEIKTDKMENEIFEAPTDLESTAYDLMNELLADAKKYDSSGNNDIARKILYVLTDQILGYINDGSSDQFASDMFRMTGPKPLTATRPISSAPEPPREEPAVNTGGNKRPYFST